MSQRFDIPQLNKIYANIPDGPSSATWINQEYSLNGKVYIFCKINANQYIRRGDLLYVNANGDAVIAKNASFIANAVSEWDIDASLAIQYSLVVKSGNTMVSVAPDSVTCVNSSFEGAFAIAYMNGASRVSNARFTLPVTYMVTDTLTCAISIQRATEANAAILANVGDVVNTNVGISGVITQIPNGSTIVLGTSALGTANAASVLCVVTAPTGSILKQSMIVTCANSIWRITVGGTTGYPKNTPATGNVNSNVTGFFNQVNVCSSGTVMFVNSCVAGQLIKVGDLLLIQSEPSYSNRAVTSINNAYAFTVNAAANAENSFALGIGINVNSKFIMAQINPL